MNILHLESQVRGLRIPYTVNFPHCPHLTLLCSGFSIIFFCYIIYRVNISVILSSLAVGSILRNKNQVQIKKQRPIYFFCVHFTNLFVMAREENTINKEAGSGSCVLLSEYLFWQCSGVL